MILDTTYLLPLVRVAIDTDLLGAIAQGKTHLKFEEVAVSLISIFELQAKAAKLMIPAKFAVKAVEAILTTFRVKPFHEPKVIEVSFKMRRLIPDYIDCVIAATAVVLKEDLATEDSLILANAEALRREHGIRVLRFRELAR